jgi:ABC-type lipopolysaccharide export system ATPase subunit
MTAAFTIDIEGVSPRPISVARDRHRVSPLGPNGAGKTTTFYMIVGLISPDSGTVRLDDEDLTRCPCTGVRARGSAIWPRSRPSFVS